MRSPLSLLPFVASAAATTSILLPLYIYPGSNSAATPNAVNWANVTAAVAAYPSVNWWIVVNPNSGPGTTQYPDSNYIKGISQLNSYSNVYTLGYVDTDYTRRAYKNVTGNITTYAGWANYASANIAMDGIFFDDVPNSYLLQTQYPKTRAGNDTYYKNATTFAYNTVPSDFTPVVLNPGSPAPSEFFSYADIVVEDEIPYSSYNGQTTLNDLKTNGAIFNQTSIILHDVPTTLSTANLNSLVHTIKTNNVAFISLTQDCCYNAVNGTFLKAVASAVNSA